MLDEINSYLEGHTNFLTLIYFIFSYFISIFILLTRGDSRGQWPSQNFAWPLQFKRACLAYDVLDNSAILVILLPYKAACDCFESEI